MSVHHFQIRSLHFYLQQVQQHGSSRMGLGWQSSHQKDTSIIQVKIFFTFLWDVQDSSKTKTRNGWLVTLPNYWNVGLQWWSLHDGPRKQATALTSKPQSSVYAGLVWSSTNLNFRWNNFFFFILLFGRVLMAKLQCEIEPPYWRSLDRSAIILGSGLIMAIILIFDDVYIDHQCYFDKGSRRVRKVQFFLTLFKRPLTPPPFVWTSYGEFFWRNFNKSA